MYVSKAFKNLLVLSALLLTGCLSLEMGEKSVPGCDSNGKSPEMNPHCQDEDDKSSTNKQSTLNYKRAGHVAVRLQNGKVLVLGGLPNTFTGDEESEIYEPSSNTWKLGPKPVVSNRYFPKGVLLNDGRVLVVGGETNNPNPTSQSIIEVYDPVLDKFTAVATSANPRAGATITKLNDGRVLILGGSSFNFTTSTWSRYNDGEIFDPSTDQLNPIAGNMSVGRAGHSATLMDDGNVLISGGNTVSGVTATTEIFNAANGSISITNALHTARSNHYSSLLPDGRVIAVGGWNEVGGLVSPLKSVEAYSGTFEFQDDMPKKTYAGGYTTLDDGRVVVAGGDEATNGDFRHDSVYLYDLYSDEFVLNTHLAYARTKHTVTELSDGTLLVVGGVLTGNSWNHSDSVERISLVAPKASAFETVDFFSIAQGAGMSANAIAHDSQGRIYAFGTSFGSWHWVLRKSSDGGNTWSTIMPIEPSGMTDGMAYSIAIDSSDNIYVGGLACNQPGTSGGCNNLVGVVRKSTDLGQTWTTVDMYPTGGGSGMPFGPRAMAVDDSDNIYVGGSTGIKVSTNGGATWTTVDSGHGVATSMTISSSGKIYWAGYNGLQWIVRKSSGLGQPWSTIDSYIPNAPGDFALAKTIAVDNSENVFVGGFQGVWFGGFCKWCSAGWIIRKGANGGASWSTVDSLPYDTTLNSGARISWATAMTVDSKGNVFVAGADGNKWIVKVSRNSGSSWTTIDDVWGAWGPASIGIVKKSLFVGGQSSDWQVRRLDLHHF